jgi:hypothetical protein
MVLSWASSMMIVHCFQCQKKCVYQTEVKKTYTSGKVAVVSRHGEQHAIRHVGKAVLDVHPLIEADTVTDLLAEGYGHLLSDALCHRRGNHSSRVGAKNLLPTLPLVVEDELGDLGRLA